VYKELHPFPTRCAIPSALHNLISTPRRPSQNLFHSCQQFTLLRQPPVKGRGNRPLKELEGLVEAELALDAGVDHVAVGVGVQGQLPLLHLLEQGQGLGNKPVAGVTGQHLQGRLRSENEWGVSQSANAKRAEKSWVKGAVNGVKALGRSDLRAE
jgi:hypothetical protein